MQGLRHSATELLALAATLLAVTPAVFAQGAETLISFDPTVPETPESIVFDSQDNAYVTMALTGEIRRIAPDLSQTSLASLPIGRPCDSITLAAGLAIDHDDRLYIALKACDPANSGIWQVDTDTGNLELVANAPSPSTVWNGIDVGDGFLYAADSFDGLLWRIPVDADGSDNAPGSDSDTHSDSDPASGVPEIWSDDPLLKVAPGSPFPGPNGVQLYRGSIYVANSSTGNVVKIPIADGGAAGQPSVFVSVAPQGCDEFTFDALGRLYCATDPFLSVLRLSAGGTVEPLLTDADLLDGPTSVAFGRKGANRQNLYVTNAAFPHYSKNQRPSLMRLRLEVAGDPDEY